MVQLELRRPKVINQLFGVPKDESKERLVIYVLDANMVFEKTLKIDLLRPLRIADLFIELQFPLHEPEFDMNHYYHSLSTLECMCKTFGPSSIKINREKLWPVLRTFKMKWSHSL